METKGERRQRKRFKKRYGMRLSGYSTKHLQDLVNRRANGDLPKRKKRVKR